MPSGAESWMVGFLRGVAGTPPRGGGSRVEPLNNTVEGRCRLCFLLVLLPWIHLAVDGTAGYFI